tara:strand:+ start:384 stop:770 length:387 start_codon:yes stop_codon:yes gene_type:complete
MTYNNSVHLTDISVLECLTFGEGRITFKYGKSRSIERQTNGKYEQFMCCENQKTYVHLEIFVLQRLSENTKYTSSNTSSFFFINEKCFDGKDIMRKWFELQMTIMELQQEYYSNQEKYDVEIENTLEY